MALGETEFHRGVQTDFSNDMPSCIYHNIRIGGFNFIVAPLRVPDYRQTPDILQVGSLEVPIRTALPFAGSDLTVSRSLWNYHVVGKISSWIDLDSKDKTLRMDSEAALEQKIAWASYLCLQVCLIPAPKGTSCFNYARCVNKILRGPKNMKLWLRIPLVKPNDDSSASSNTLVDSWELRNSFRLLCEHHSNLLIALDFSSPLPSDNSLERWFGESVITAIIHTDEFSTKDRDNSKFLSRSMEKLVTDFLNHSMQRVPDYRQTPDILQVGSLEVPIRTALQFAGSDLIVSRSLWNSHVVGKISSWIDLDSKYKTLRMDSEAALEQEIASASYLCLQACLIPPAPKGTSCFNYARCVNKILRGPKNMKLWLRIPLVKPNDDSSASSNALIAYFIEPSHDCLVECLSTCISDSNPPKFSPILCRTT